MQIEDEIKEDGGLILKTPIVLNKLGEVAVVNLNGVDFIRKTHFDELVELSKKVAVPKNGSERRLKHLIKLQGFLRKWAVK